MGGLERPGRRAGRPTPVDAGGRRPRLDRSPQLRRGARKEQATRRQPASFLDPPLQCSYLAMGVLVVRVFAKLCKQLLRGTVRLEFGPRHDPWPDHLEGIGAGPPVTEGSWSRAVSRATVTVTPGVRTALQEAIKVRVTMPSVDT
jgi:hypothetical protein